MVRPNNSIGKDAGSTFPAKPNDVAGIGELDMSFMSKTRLSDSLMCTRSRVVGPLNGGSRKHSKKHSQTSY